MINEIWSARNWWTIKLFTAVSIVHLPLSNKQLRALPSCFLHYSKVLQTRMCCCWLNQRCQVPQFPHGQPNSAENTLNLRLRRKKKESLKFAIAVFLKLLWASEGWGVELWSRKKCLQSNGYKNLLVFSLTHSSNVPWLYPPPSQPPNLVLTRVSVLNQMDVGCWNITSLTPSKIFHSEKLYFWNK